MDYPALVEQLVARDVLRTPSVIEAFREVRRESYLPRDVIEYAGEDRPLAIGHGQTNSQPYTVAFMLELLQPGAGDRILDVGCGSGWTTALLAYIVGERGAITGTERVADLAERAKLRIESAAIDNAEILYTPDTLGWPDLAPYDRILVSAAANNLPDPLVDQLEVGGIMVIPIQHSICRITKSDTSIETEEYPGFSFVPLI